MYIVQNCKYHNEAKSIIISGFWVPYFLDFQVLASKLEFPCLECFEDKCKVSPPNTFQHLHPNVVFCHCLVVFCVWLYMFWQMRPSQQVQVSCTSLSLPCQANKLMRKCREYYNLCIRTLVFKVEIKLVIKSTTYIVLDIWKIFWMKFTHLVSFSNFLYRNHYLCKLF